jgi:hypothetical protein
MMARPVRIKLNHAGVADLLTSSEVASLLAGMGQAIADAAGSGHRVETEVGPSRVRVDVFTETFEAMEREATTRSLTRAIDAGRA